MATVSDLATQYNVSSSTIRAWSKEFGEYLSGNATPDSGEVRIYGPQDGAVLGLVAQMRAEGLPYEAIHQALASGERATIKEPAAAPEGEAGTGLTLAQMSALLGEQRGELGALREERDYLRDKVESLQEEANSLRERATAAETRLEVLSGHQERERPAAPDTAPDQRPAEQRRRWWQWWGK